MTRILARERNIPALRVAQLLEKEAGLVIDENLTMSKHSILHLHMHGMLASMFVSMAALGNLHVDTFASRALPPTNPHSLHVSRLLPANSVLVCQQAARRRHVKQCMHPQSKPTADTRTCVAGGETCQYAAEESACVIPDHICNE
jgi:hypothetical protein